MPYNSTHIFFFKFPVTFRAIINVFYSKSHIILDLRRFAGEPHYVLLLVYYKRLQERQAAFVKY